MTGEAFDTRVFANLGCGPKGGGRVPAFFRGWEEIRVDSDPAVEPELLADLTDLSAIRDDSLDGVWAAHCIEHLYLHDVDTALSEIARILAPNGVACIIVPDLQSIAGFIASDKMHEPLYRSAAGPITPHDVVFGYGTAIAEGRHYMAHRSGFTPGLISEKLNKAQFGQFVLFRRATYELAVVAHKTQWRSVAERDAMIAALGI